MLVLTRKCRQAVVVGGADALACLLKVTVLEIGSGRVRLGFEAADHLPVHRWEVWQRIRINGDSRSDSTANGPATAPAA